MRDDEIGKLFFLRLNTIVHTDGKLTPSSAAVFQVALRATTANNINEDMVDWDRGSFIPVSLIALWAIKMILQIAFDF